MKQNSNKPLQTGRRTVQLLVLLPGVLIILLFGSAVADQESAERIVTLRYLLFALSGVFAFILPYLSFPDPLAKIYQLGNLSPEHLLQRYVRRHRPTLLTTLCLVLATAVAGQSGEFFTAETLLLLFYGCFFVSGIYMLAAARYLKIGRDSQIWQEGEKGREVRKRISELAKYPVDSGSIPSLLATILLSVSGMLTVVAGAFLYLLAGLWTEIIIGVLLFLMGLFRLLKVRPEGDRQFYQTQSFFSEFFGTTVSSADQREPLQVQQLWWIPKRWKVHAWGMVLQMDRKFPPGRVVAMGHLFLWVVAYQGVDRPLMMALWITFAIAHQALLLLTAGTMMPKWWLQSLDSPGNWVLTRIWVQTRWLVPLFLSMMVMDWLFSLFNWTDLGLITLLYLLSAGVVALLISARHERQWTN